LKTVEGGVDGAERNVATGAPLGGGLYGDAVSVGLSVSNSKHDKLLESAQGDWYRLIISGSSIS